MIVVKVELHSAITGKVTELARMHICNDGAHANHRMGNYTFYTLRGRSMEQLDRLTVQRKASIRDWPRLQLHVWNLVTECLRGMGYGNQQQK